MRNFFLKVNLFFCLKIFLLTFLGLTYYIFSTFIKTNTRNDYLVKEDIADKTEGIYKYSLDTFLTLIENLTQIIDFMVLKTDLITNGEVKVNDKVYTDLNIFTDENFPNVTIPKIDGIEYPKLGNLLMPIISEAADSDENSIQSQFNQLYNGDACYYLFKDSEDMVELIILTCQLFWNGIIAKGMEQALTQMSVSISSVLDEVRSVNRKDVTKDEIKGILKSDSYFINFLIFMDYYFYEAYLSTSSLFNSLRTEIVKNIKKKFIILLVLYLIVSVFLFVLIMLYIYSLRNYFNSFLYFIAIFPLKFLAEEENLFRQILKLDDNLFK